MSQVVNGSPSVLVRRGQYIQRNMDEERISPEELFEAMHESGLERLEQVRWAILESDGRISIIPEEEAEGLRKGEVKNVAT